MDHTNLQQPSAFQFFKHYTYPYRWRLATLFAVMAATIALSIVAPVLAARFVDGVIAGEGQSMLVRLALLTLLVALVTQILAVAETWLAEHVAWQATNRLRLDLIDHLLTLDAQFHAEHPAGELIGRVDGDVSTLANMFSRFVVTLLGNGTLVIALLGTIIWIDPFIGVAMTVGAMILMGIVLRIQKSAQPHWAANRQLVGEYSGLVGEYTAGAEDIRASGAVAYAMRNHALLLRAWLPVRIRSEMMGYSMASVTSFAFALALVGGVIGAVHRVQDGAMTIGSVFLLTRLIMMLNEPLSRLRDELHELQQASAGFTRVRELIAVPSRIVDSGTVDVPDEPLDIQFDQVTFGYHPDQPVLREVSMHVPAGNVVGIVGRTGSGKTSMTRLIPRLYDPQQGAVRLGGVDLRDLRLTDLRSRIGIVTQDVHLMHGTLRDNLTLFDATIADARLLDVLTQIGMIEWYARQPLGLDTVLGVDGVTLSAGEAQLLTCARALLQDPDIVILDEASARLDPATDRLLHAALAELLRNRTAILVAHRMSTLAFADSIVVLHNGEVIEHGPRSELAADPNSHFARLLRHAHSEELT